MYSSAILQQLNNAPFVWWLMIDENISGHLQSQLLLLW